MKILKLASLTLAVIFSYCVNAQSTFTQDKFMIMSYGDPVITYEGSPVPQDSLRVLHLDKLKLLRDAYFNLMSGNHIHRNNITAANIYLLKLLDNINNSRSSTNTKLKLLVRDSRFEYYDNLGAGGWQTPDINANNNNYNYDGNCTYCNDSYVNMINDYLGLTTSEKENIYGFNLKDEPTPSTCGITAATTLLKMKNWRTVLKNSFPSKMIFNNIVANYGFQDWFSGCGGTYEDHIEEFISDPLGLNADVGCFDHYPFYISGGNLVTRNNYFQNLSTMRKTIGEKPMWAYVMSSQHFDYADPTEEKLRFMAFCPIAYGAKGLGYFMYERPEWSPPYFGPTNSNFIINGYDPLTTTQRYLEVKNINHYIDKLIGPMVMNSTWIGAFHKSNLPNNESQLNPNGSLENELLSSPDNKWIADVNDDNILFGIFQNGSNPCTNYSIPILIVNKSLTPTSNPLQIYLKTNSSTFFPPNANSYNIRVFEPVGTYNSPYNGSTSYTSNNITPIYSQIGNGIEIPQLKGGEARLIRIDYQCLQTFGIINTQASNDSITEEGSSKPSASLTVFPNPASSQINLQYKLTNVSPSQRIQIKIADSYGVMKANLVNDLINTTEAYQTISFDVSEMPNGLYHAMLFIDDVLQTHETIHLIK